MTDGAGPPLASAPAIPQAETAGAIIRRLRESRGIHIGIVAATLKVPVRKLEALEADRQQEFANISLMRALAQSVCRVLKVDPAPVLAALPQTEGWPGGVAPWERTPLAEPEAQASGALGPAPAQMQRRSRRLWALAALLMVLALAAWWAIHSSDVATRAVGPAKPVDPGSLQSAPAAPGLSSASTETSSRLNDPPRAPASEAGAVGAVGTAPPSATGRAGTGDVQSGERSSEATVTVSAASWVEATDSEQRVVLSRVIAAGDTVGLKGRPPWRLVIGNATATEVRLRGRLIDLAPHTRENVARVELN